MRGISGRLGRIGLDGVFLRVASPHLVCERDDGWVGLSASKSGSEVSPILVSKFPFHEFARLLLRKRLVVQMFILVLPCNE